MDLGPPQLVDAFANGWHVTAADLHALGGPGFTVELTWTPQREVWAALAVSGATLLLCLVLGFLPARWRRRVRAHLPRRLRGAAGPDAPERPGSPFDAATLAWPGAPPPKDERQRGWLRFPRALLIGALTGGVAALVAPPVAALVVAGVVILGLLVPWARAVATVGGIAFVVAGCVNVVQGQNVHHYLPGSNWAGSFVHAGNLIWVGVSLLLADAVISGLGLRVKKPLGRRATRAEKAQEPPAPTATGAPAAPGAPGGGRLTRPASGSGHGRRLPRQRLQGAACGGAPGEPAGPGQCALGEAAAQHLVTQHALERGGQLAHVADQQARITVDHGVGVAGDGGGHGRGAAGRRLGQRHAPALPLRAARHHPGPPVPRDQLLVADVARQAHPVGRAPARRAAPRGRGARTPRR